MRKLILLGLLLGVMSLSACNDNVRSRYYGGNQDVVLPKGKKLVTATWKEGSLWYLTRPARTGELPETTVFQEQSGFGIMEGTVTFKEQ